MQQVRLFDVGQLPLPDEYLTGWTTSTPPPATIHARAQIARLRADGLGPTAIARRLSREGVSTPTGIGPWRCETVLRVENPDAWAAYMRAYRARKWA